MAKKMEWTVRVIIYDRGAANNGLHLAGIWVEQLRYMGLARCLASFDYPSRDIVEFYCPKGLDSKVWADQNAARMQSFGIDAAAAPRWKPEDSAHIMLKDVIDVRGGAVAWALASMDHPPSILQSADELKAQMQQDFQKEPIDLCNRVARRKSLCGQCICKRPYDHKGGHFCPSCGWEWGPKPLCTEEEKKEASRNG